MAGSVRSLRSPRGRDRMRSSSAPASRLLPKISATRIAAIFRVPTIPGPQASKRLAQKPARAAVYLSERLSRWEAATAQLLNIAFGRFDPFATPSGMTGVCAHRTAGVDGCCSLLGQGRKLLPDFDAFGCLRSLRARSALNEVSWVQGC